MTLESFDAEPGTSVGTQRAEIALNEAAAGGIAFWGEAVAVVEQLCEVLAHDGREQRVPALEDVLLNGEGQVRIVYGSRGEKGPVAVAWVLQTLLGATDVPVQLRLFLSQATAPETHGSIREFAQGLAYFGRSDRAELIQAVYQRCAGRPAGAQPLALLPTPPKPPETAKAQSARRAGTPGRSRQVAWIAAGTLLLAGGAAAWVWSDRNPDGAATAAVGAVDAVTGALGELTTTARELLGEPRIVAREEEAADGGALPGAAGARATGSASRSGAGAPALASAPTPRETPAGTPTTVALAAVEPAPVTTVGDRLPEGPDASPASVPARTTAALDSLAIYSGEDRDVVPPSLLTTQLPAPLVTVEDQAPTVNRMEVLVSADGTVERVRLLAGPRRMPDMMLLSGAKTWRFEPALKDGVPVRYLTVLSWTVTP